MDLDGICDRPLLEVCVDDAGGLAAARRGGADRIELCSALALDGLTPSTGLMQIASTLDRPVYAMIRPRGGDFVFSDADADIMLRDIDAARAAGLPGVVLGANRPSGELDAGVLTRLCRHAAGLGMTLHRSIDLVPDPIEAVDLAAELGFERILTSGGAETAENGADRIARMVARAGKRLSIMAGSGVTPANAPDILSRTGVRELHGSCSAPAEANAGFATLAPSASRETRSEIVAEMVAVLTRHASRSRVGDRTLSSASS
ncbi:copper homeostasis protein CutC [Caulobacter segnis]|uniref:copper homeostasis protein CutC n=1 Tax=Caulobacter segnis TaxID=88688 RepID=UPI00285E8661|nr:copper homeostasis protein CutC [Caulobacter segnis]MDR6625896.1 copper homeostasis protein [Caulobacter segnis]